MEILNFFDLDEVGALFYWVTIVFILCYLMNLDKLRFILIKPPDNI